MARAKESSDDRGQRYRAPALEKGLDILELLADRPDGLSQTEIAKELRRTVGEIFRMLNCLVERDYVTIRRPGDRYVSTLKLFELSHKNPPLPRLLHIALPMMHELAIALTQSTHLTVVEAGHGVIIAQVDSPGPIGFSVRVGSVLDLANTASGHVLLAFRSKEDRQRLFDRRASEVHKFGALDAGSLVPRDKAIAQVATQGFAEMESTRIRGIHDISFPILDHNGGAVAALTMPFIQRLDLDGESTLEAARLALGRAASRLSTLIGGGAPRPHHVDREAVHGNGQAV